ncbi:MAG: peroxidase family protein [Solirubrobacteraceae bacterium]
MRRGRGQEAGLDSPRAAGRRALATLAGALLAALLLAAQAAAASPPVSFEVPSLNGTGNNLAHPSWGAAGTPYQRLAPANYADGVGAMVGGPNPRYVSNRVFNSLGVDIFSPRNVSQWAWVWGQFVDHTIERAEPGSEEANISFEANDPLERFTDTLGVIPFTRNAVAPGTGTGAGNPRQQVNMVNSYIDGAALYGSSQSRLEWMRTGPDNGNPAAAGALLLLPKKYLPLESARGAAHPAPSMVVEGALEGDPQNAVVAGDARANENAELTAVTTLFAREHNRIAKKLPSSLSSEERFQIARLFVGAEEQYITYNEFLPAVGVTLSPYDGYQPNVDPEVNDEFATVGYRAHSMVNGEEHVEVPASKFRGSKLAALEAMGIGVETSPASRSQLRLTISQGAAFFDPAVVSTIGLGPILAGLGEEPSYRNDEQIDDSLRSILFAIPQPGTDPALCFENPQEPGCFSVVEDLGAIDIERGRDNGIPSYNRMREAVGLAPQSTFTEVTGESSEEFPVGDPLLPPSDQIDNPHILDFTSMQNFYGEPIAPGSEERAVQATRRTTLAARLKAIYGSVDNMDAIVGMMSEPHLPGSELGELQQALWRKQFEALRDGDRFFYLNDPTLATLESRYGLTYKHSLSELISLDGKVSRQQQPQADVFYAPTPVRGGAAPSRRLTRRGEREARRSARRATR